MKHLPNKRVATINLAIALSCIATIVVCFYPTTRLPQEHSANHIITIPETSPHIINLGRIVGTREINTSITLRNSYSHPVTIQDTKGSCSCTVASVSSHQIEPNDTTTLSIKLTPPSGMTQAAIEKPLTITFSDPSLPTCRIRLTAEVSNGIEISKESLFFEPPNFSDTLTITRNGLPVEIFHTISPQNTDQYSYHKVSETEKSISFSITLNKAARFQDKAIPVQIFHKPFLNQDSEIIFTLPGFTKSPYEPNSYFTSLSNNLTIQEMQSRSTQVIHYIANTTKKIINATLEGDLTFMRADITEDSQSVSVSIKKRPDTGFHSGKLVIYLLDTNTKEIERSFLPAQIYVSE